MQRGRTFAPALALLVLAAAAAVPARAAVVINEIFYNAPDDLDELQWIELHNPETDAADLSNWKLDKGEKFTFPEGTKIEPGGYLVVALKPDVFKQHYRLDAIGPLKKDLKRSGERLELANDRDEVVDAIRYHDRYPYPLSADGESASLERICPTAPAESAENWAASPLPAVQTPSGTPGKQNAAFSATLPPVITKLSITPEDPTAQQELRVELELKSPDQLADVTLLYRLVRDNAESADTPIAMQRDGATARFTATIPAQEAGTIVRCRVKATDKAGAVRLSPDAHDVRPALSVLVRGDRDPSALPAAEVLTIRSSDPAQRKPRGLFSLFGANPDRPESDGPRPPRGSSAFIFTNPATGKTELFDYVHAHPRGRGRGYTVHFHKDLTFDRMTAVTILHEGSDRHLLAEFLAYDLYRRAGNIAPASRFVRFSLDSRPMGHHLMLERPNKGFLRHNRFDDSGNLYKIVWYRHGLVGQHEKRTNPRTGHADLVALVEQLNRTAADPDAQWKVIQENFDVQNAATFFAINMVLSDWDGFFNNYYTYHEPKTNKWLLIPWDRDKTWGYHDGIGQAIFTDMPITNGMEGDQPPGQRNPPLQRGRGNPFGHAAAWWRPGGYFSRPLLANPHFRRLYLEKIRDILERQYTKEVYFPLIEGLAEQIKGDLTQRAQATNSDAAFQTRRVDEAADLLKMHLTQRREFLLAQDELAALSKNSK